jgi:hypothetical protein
MTKIVMLREAVARAERQAKAADDAALQGLACAAFLATYGFPVAQMIAGPSLAQREAYAELRAARKAYDEACAVDRETAPLARDNKPFSIWKS